MWRGFLDELLSGEIAWPHYSRIAARVASDVNQ